MSVKSGNKQKNRNQVALSALAASMLMGYIAQAHALTTVPDDVNVTGYAQIGTTTTASTTATGAGSGSTPPPPSVNNGNGTTTLYNITGYGASNVTTTTTTGGVLAEPNGNITGTGGSQTTSSTTFDMAAYIIVASSNVSQVITTGTSQVNTMTTTTTNSTGGGNLVMSGNGTFGGNLTVNGTTTMNGALNVGQINGNGPNGTLTLHGGTASTTVTLSNSGMQVLTTGTPYGGGGIITAQDDLILNADTDGGGWGGVVMQKNGTTLMSVGTGYSSNVDVYTTLDMHGNNINNVGTITATTGNITTVNSTTVNTNTLNANTANIGQMQMSGNMITAPDDMYINVDAGPGGFGGYGSLIIQKANQTLATFNEEYTNIGNNYSSLTLDSSGATFAGEGGSPVQVHGVAKGTAKTDAVNVGQLKDQYDSLAGGIASIAAIANIPHVDPKKTFAVGIGYGNYDGSNGYAFGGSYRFMEDGIIKASVAGSDDGETAWGLGAGFSW